MAFGDLITNGTGSLVGNSIGAINDIPINGGTGVTVAVGDLIIAVMSQQTGLTASSAGDNLHGLSPDQWSAQNPGSDPGAVTGRMFYKRVTVGGTLTNVYIKATSSTNNFACCAAVFSGLFADPPIDKNPANTTADVTSPLIGPPTGTRTVADELIVGWASGDNANADSSSAPWTVAIDAIGSSCHACITSKVVTSVSTSPTDDAPIIIAATNPTVGVLGTASFAKDTLQALTQTATHTDTDTVDFAHTLTTLTALTQTATNASDDAFFTQTVTSVNALTQTAVFGDLRGRIAVITQS